MELGFVGLGKMGKMGKTVMNMVERLRRDRHKIVVFDIDDAKLSLVRSLGAGGVNTLKDLVSSLTAPRGVWVMVPASEPSEGTIKQLGSFAEQLLAALRHEFGGHAVVENRE
jgi:6-phosphogluconate dehydrogenase